MNPHGMYLAMLLSNARRAEAAALLLAAEPAPARIELLMPDGQSRPFPAPPLETVRALIELLETGERDFSANVHSARIEQVEITRAPGRLNARIDAWEIEK